MTTQSRIRPRADIGRWRLALAGPGADTRTWCAYARIDDDPDAITWDDELGWLVDVTVVGGPLDGEGPVVARFPFGWLADGEMRSEPVTRGAHVVLAISDGELLVPPCIVGYVPDPDFAPPSEINGQSIDEAFAQGSHLWLTGKGVQWATGAAVWTFPSLVLVSADASQQAVRGSDQKDALDSFLDAFDAWAALVAAGIAAGGGTLDNTAILEAVSELRSGLAAALSTKVKLE